MDREHDTTNASTGEVTALLHQISAGDVTARDRLIACVYPDLRVLAQRHMSKERYDHTLQATALVNEFFLEMVRTERQIWSNRSHFLAAASQAMRRLLVDHARARNTIKRGGRNTRVELERAFGGSVFSLSDMIELDDLLELLSSEEPRMARVVELRFFGGLTNAEIGEVLGIDERTAKRDWKVAKAWLSRHLRRSAPYEP